MHTEAAPPQTDDTRLAMTDWHFYAYEDAERALRRVFLFEELHAILDSWEADGVEKQGEFGWWSDEQHRAALELATSPGNSRWLSAFWRPL